MISLFSKTKDLVMKIDNFIDLTVAASLHLREGIKEYMDGRFEDFEKRLSRVIETENNADNLRKEIESRLYSHTLIPESRGDVLGVLESMDTIIDTSKGTLFEFSIEKPVIPMELKADFINLSEPVIKSVEALAYSARAFFYDVYAVKDHVHIVKFYEKECDTSAERIKRKVFASELGLSQKMQLRNLISQIDSLADNAEMIADRLSIASIKRIV
jgi:predicted phosphate transport protein (TIGR00153 family)